MKEQFIAHIKKNPDGSWAEPHLLKNHLTNTAKKASEFANEFGKISDKLYEVINIIE